MKLLGVRFYQQEDEFYYIRNYLKRFDISFKLFFKRDGHLLFFVHQTEAISSCGYWSFYCRRFMIQKCQGNQDSTKPVEFVEILSRIFYWWFQLEKLGWESESTGLGVKGTCQQNIPFPP